MSSGMRISRGRQRRGRSRRRGVSGVRSRGTFGVIAVVGGVEVRRWDANFPDVDPGMVVIESFACQLPERFVAAMAACKPAPVWINRVYRGELLAWTRADTSFAQFGRTRPQWRKLLVDRQTATSLDAGNDASRLSSGLEQVLRELSGTDGETRVAVLNTNQEKAAIAKVDIAQTPLAFVSITSEHIADRDSMYLLLLAAGVIPLVVLLFAFLELRERHRLERLSEQARAEAERLAQARSDFLANMSHEIRTPMNAILGMTELCLGTTLNHKQHNYLSKIQGASESLLRIVNDVLDFSKVESGKLEIERVPFDLDRVLDDLGGLFSEKASKKFIELSFAVDRSGAQAFLGDPLRLEQILVVKEI